MGKVSGWLLSILLFFCVWYARSLVVWYGSCWSVVLWSLLDVIFLLWLLLKKLLSVWLSLENLLIATKLSSEFTNTKG